jgi:hypothetical protein
VTQIISKSWMLNNLKRQMEHAAITREEARLRGDLVAAFAALGELQSLRGQYETVLRVECQQAVREAGYWKETRTEPARGRVIA